MAGALTTEDRLAVLDLMARYNWAFDSGDGKAYAALWVADGVLTGGAAPAKGHGELEALVVGSHAHFKGGVRHHTTDVVAEYGSDKNTINAKSYTLVTDWANGGKIFALAQPESVWVREGSTWKIKAINLNLRLAGV